MSRAPQLSLPQDDDAFDQSERRQQIFVQQQVFQPDADAGLPMPMASAASVAPVTPLDWTFGQARNQVAIALDLQGFDPGSRKRFAEPADFAQLFTTLRRPEIIATWTDDRVFADQRLAGLNPLAIRRVTADGRGVGSDWSALRAKLGPAMLTAVVRGVGGDVDRAIAAGRVYVTDYEQLRDACVTAGPGAQSGRELMAPIGVFVRAADHDGIVPVAIQLDQEPRSQYATPGSDPSTWLAAKTCLQCADVNLNQLVNHLCMTHLIEDAIALATYRQFAPQHPLHALLSRHFAALLAINLVGQQVLLSPEGVVQQILEVGVDGGKKLIAAAYERWSFFDLDFRGDLRRRGVDDAKLLPHYPYRDDGDAIWQALDGYARDYLAVFYGDPALVGAAAADAKVQGDTELQGWAAELSRDAGGTGKVPGFPGRIASFADLHRIVTVLLWTAGPQHAAVNFPQVDYTAFAPSMPTALYHLPGTGDPNLVADMLPSIEAAIGQFRVSFTLAGYRYDRLLDYGDDFAGSGKNTQAQSVIATWFERLSGPVSRRIEAADQVRRNRGFLSYPYLLPANIPNSTSI